MSSDPKPPARLPKELLAPWLLLLLELRPGYGYEMRRGLLERGFHADPSSVYRNLREMEAQGLVASHWTDESEGPKRRVYTLTDRGRTELEESATAFRKARNAQSAFLRAYKAGVA